jgi:hypothetical protein
MANAFEEGNGMTKRIGNLAVAGAVAVLASVASPVPALAQGAAYPRLPDRPLPDVNRPSGIRDVATLGMHDALARCDEDAFYDAKNRLVDFLDGEIAAGRASPDMVSDRQLAWEAVFPEPCEPGRAGQSYRIGATWQPIRDIRFRGNFTRSVRAPAIVELFAPASRVLVEETGIGVTRDGAIGHAPDRDAGLTDGSISTVGLGAAVHLGTFSFYGSYQNGSGRTLFDLAPIQGGFNGVVFGQLSEAQSAGIGSGLASLVGSTRTEVSRFRLGGDMEIASPAPRTRVFFAYDYFRDVRTHEMNATGTVVFPTQTIEFSQERRQRISDNFFAAGLGAEARIPLTPDGADGGAGLSARVIGVVEGYLLDSNLNSHERNLSNFGPASDRDFTIDIEQSEQDFGVTARGQINFEYVVSPQFAIFVGGTGAWFSQGGAVFNPNSGDQVSTGGLSTAQVDGEFWSYGAIVGVRFPIR